MTSEFKITADWLNGDVNEPLEQATFAEVNVEVAQQVVSNLYQPGAETVLSGPRLPASVLGQGLIRRWWTLLYEPQRTLERHPRDPVFEARHRLDTLTNGYVFPPLAIWSGGETVLAQLFSPDVRFQTQRFSLPEVKEPWSLQRGASRRNSADSFRAS